MDNYTIKRYVAELADSLTYVRSIDGFLIKLGTIVLSLEDECRGTSNCDPSILLKNILQHDKVSRNLSRFSCYVEEIINTIMRDPRHKVMRKYIDILRDVLEKITCVESPEVERVTPPALWLKEHEEHVQRTRATYKRIRRLSFKGSVESVLKIGIIVSVLLYILSLIIILFS